MKGGMGEKKKIKEKKMFPSIFWATKQRTENVLNRENEKLTDDA